MPEFSGVPYKVYTFSDARYKKEKSEEFEIDVSLEYNGKIVYDLRAGIKRIPVCVTMFLKPHLYGESIRKGYQAFSDIRVERGFCTRMYELSRTIRVDADG